MAESNAPRRIKLHMYERCPSKSSASGFCAKMESYLILAGIPYDHVVVNNPASSPRAKLPFITDAEGVTVPDSHFIIRHLSEKGYGDLNKSAGITDAQLAEANAFRIYWEEKLYVFVSYLRWTVPEIWPLTFQELFGNIPWPINRVVAYMAQRGVKNGLMIQGVAKYSREEADSILVQGIKDTDIRLSQSLKDGGKYFFGKQGPAEIDAVLFGFLSSCATAISMPIVTEHILASPSIVKYLQGLQAEYFPQLTDLRDKLATAGK